ncbi:DUF6702 family protein [Maricaulis sp.]|uniref:DUF6702 family protein n=1 Tax=unclassified Maricaulis TaxID=2632371 RepID=UPI001B09810D|nr:DUF6702 family protein [Maricaulis sp.]MBO6797837.1 hypothetical protein [Maricaulis sp.]
MTAPVQAHRMKAGATEIAVNERTGEMEIIHRVYAHDLLEALGNLELDETELLSSQSGLAQIEQLVRAEFRVAEGDGRLLELTYVGAELDGEFAWIYFTASAPEDTSSFVVDNDILSNAFEDQVMMTNFRFNSDVRTAMQGPGRRDPIRVRFTQ